MENVVDQETQDVGTDVLNPLAIEFLGHIQSHSVRNLASLDKKLSFSTTFADNEAMLKGLAQYLLSFDADQIFRIKLEPVED